MTKKKRNLKLYKAKESDMKIRYIPLESSTEQLSFTIDSMGVSKFNGCANTHQTIYFKIATYVKITLKLPVSTTYNYSEIFLNYVSDKALISEGKKDISKESETQVRNVSYFQNNLKVSCYCTLQHISFRCHNKYPAFTFVI